jgi:hypothetical protein
LLAIASATAPATAGSVPADGRLSFVVTRDGTSIGRHDVTFERQGQRLIVKTETEIEVDVLSVTLYRFEQRRTEIREGDRLVFYDSWTDNDGEILTAHAEAKGGKLEVTGTGASSVVDGSLIPTTYWDIATTSRDRLIEGSDGRVLKVSVVAAGADWLDTGSRAIEAQRFQMRGDVERDLWYDPDGIWRKLSFRVDDGSVIAYEPRP